MATRRLKPSSNSPQPPAQRAWGYARVSTDQQRDSGISLDEQRRKIEARCSENGWHKPLGVVAPGDVVIAAKMDRMFRSAFDALQTIESFKRRKISLWLLDLGNDCSGNGISELIMTVLAAVAQFERGLISERIKDAKRNLRRQGRHQGGGRPFGWRFGAANGTGRARELIPDPDEQAALADIIAMRAQGGSLMAIRDAMRARGFQISHQFVANTIARHAGGTA
jgi:DNA invertase Pin-like site-specific DNA recombinase